MEYCVSDYDIDVLLDNCDQTLFRSSLYITHCLHHLLSDKRDHTHAMHVITLSNVGNLSISDRFQTLDNLKELIISPRHIARQF